MRKFLLAAQAFMLLAAAALGVLAATGVVTIGFWKVTVAGTSTGVDILVWLTERFGWFDKPSCAA